MESTDPIESIEPIAEQPAEEPSPATQVEEPQAPPPTPKKKLSKDRLEKLAKARARASEVAKQKRERKAKPFDEPVVVVEQDESDEDTFEADSPGIIFVRRKRNKKPEPPANLMSPEQAMLYASFFGGSRSF